MLLQITVLHNPIQNQIWNFMCAPAFVANALGRPFWILQFLSAGFLLLFAAGIYPCLFCNHLDFFHHITFSLCGSVLSLDFTLQADRGSDAFFPYSLCFAVLNKPKLISFNRLPFAFITHILILVQLDFLFFRRSQVIWMH